MTEPTKYHTDMSAAQIVSLIASISNKVDQTSIKGTIPTTPVASDVASVDLLVAELKKITDVIGTAGLRVAINALTDSHIFTDDDQAKVDRISEHFVGVHADFSARDVAHPTPAEIKHNDMILVLSNNANKPTIQYWNSGSQLWTDVYDVAGSARYIQANIGEITAATFTASESRAARYMISAHAGINTQLYEVALLHDGAGIVTASTINTIKAPESADLITIAGEDSLDGLQIRLNVTTTVANVTVDIQRIALL